MMNDQNKMREWATPVTIGAFGLIALTGVMLFFKVQYGMVKPVHEWLSWLLVIGAVFFPAGRAGDSDCVFGADRPDAAADREWSQEAWETGRTVVGDHGGAIAEYFGGGGPGCPAEAGRGPAKAGSERDADRKDRADPR